MLLRATALPNLSLQLGSRPHMRRTFALQRIHRGIECARNHADIVVGHDRHGLFQIVVQQPLGSGEQEPELSWNVAVGMRGSDALLRQRIDGVIERMLADGSIRDIYARYGVEHRPPSNSR